MNNMLKTQPKHTLSFILISSILLYFIFSPAFNILYYAGDDFRYAFGGLSKACSTDDGYYFMITLGRPLQALLDCASYKFAYNLEHMQILRIISVCIMGVGMGLFAEWLFTLGFSFWSALLAAGSIFLLPRLYGDSVTTAATSLPISVLCALIAYRILQTKNGEYTWKRYGIAAIFILSSMASYPAMSFFYATLVLTKLLFSPLTQLSQTRREITRESVLFIGVGAVYFLLAYLNMHFHPQAPVPDQYHVDNPNMHFRELFDRLAIVGNVFNPLWLFYQGTSIFVQGWIVMGLFVLGVCAGLASVLKSHDTEKGKQKTFSRLKHAILWAVFLFVMSSGFFLIIPTRDLGARLLFGTAATGIVVVFWCIWRIADWFPRLSKQTVICSALALLFIVEAHQTNVTVMSTALMYEQRLNNVKALLANAMQDGKSVRRIHYVLSKDEYPYNRFFITNAALVQILGHNTFGIEWCSLARGVAGEEKDHQKEALECIQRQAANSFAVTYSFKDEPYKQTEKMLIIDPATL